MSKHFFATVFTCFLLAAIGCAEKAKNDAPQTVAGETAKASAHLAYEHRVEIELPQAQIEASLQAVRSACNDERFGACSVLALSQSDSGSARGSLTLRAAPAAIEPLVGMAGRDGKVASRELRAEDLADAVIDNERRAAMLTAHRATLAEYRERKDLSVADMISVSGELARVETQIEGVERTAANQRRRIETNLLTLTFQSRYSAPNRSTRIAEAFAGLADSLTDGFAEALAMLGFALPFLLFAFPLALIWRALWRRATRDRRS